MRESDRNENHKEDCNYKEEGHVPCLIVSVARHGTREIWQAGVLVCRPAAARVWLFDVEGGDKRCA